MLYIKMGLSFPVLTCVGLLPPLWQLRSSSANSVKFLSGNLPACQSGVQFCLKQDSANSDAHLLLAELQLAQGNSSAAAASLEMGLSSNFEVPSAAAIPGADTHAAQVREAPLYHLIQARIQQAEGKLEESIKTLNNAMKLPGIRKGTGGCAAAMHRSHMCLHWLTFCFSRRTQEERQAAYHAGRPRVCVRGAGRGLQQGGAAAGCRQGHAGRRGRVCRHQ